MIQFGVLYLPTFVGHDIGGKNVVWLYYKHQNVLTEYRYYQ